MNRPEKGGVSEDRDMQLQRMLIAIRRVRPTLAAGDRDTIKRLTERYEKPCLIASEAAIIERVYLRLRHREQAP
jgi:hypothetical protein